MTQGTSAHLTDQVFFNLPCILMLNTLVERKKLCLFWNVTFQCHAESIILIKNKTKNI